MATARRTARADSPCSSGSRFSVRSIRSMTALSSWGTHSTTRIGMASSSHQSKPDESLLRRKDAAGSPTSRPVSRDSPSASSPVTAVRRRGTLRWLAMSACTSTDHSEPGRYLPSCPTK